MSSASPPLRSLDSRNNPRRRQRDSEDGVSIRQQPLRKRSRLTRDSFKPPAEVSGHANGDAAGIRNWMNGGRAHATPIEIVDSDGSASNQPMQISYRGNVKHGSAANAGWRDDGTTKLTENSHYVVKQLPALPKQIRTSKTGYRGARVNSNGYALAVTRDQALIWDYTIAAAVPTTQALALPHPAKADDPLPLAAFVNPGSGGDMGLVVVNATSGKISFWETIENADALSLFEQRKNGIQGSCGSLMYGETVTAIEDADSAGFILYFSTGRAAQLLVRDGQSRPAISVNFLRSQKSSSGGGLFGSLRNVFGGGGWLRSVAAARTRPGTSRGQIEAIIASEEAVFQFWHLDWSGQAVLHREIDARSALEDAIAETFSSESQGNAQGLKVHDFAMDTSDANDPDLTVLVGFGPGANQSFALVVIEVEDAINLVIRDTILLDSYSAPSTPESSWKPKLLLPAERTTAFIVFGNAVVLVSLLNNASGSSSETIYFRDGDDYLPCGAMTDRCGARNRDVSLVVFLQKFGLIRVTAFANSEAQKGNQITAKSKIEQAVFFGTRESNPLNLTPNVQSKSSIDEVELAALEISQEILASESPFIPAIAPSMDHHLEQRAKNLKDLASHLRLYYPDISRATKWRLRFDAEKVAAAHQVWSSYDMRKKRNKWDARLLPNIVISINEKFKTPIQAGSGESDDTRHFFLKDVAKMGIVLVWSYTQLEHFSQDGNIRDEEQKIDLLSEANDLMIGCLTAAFQHRSQTAELYGLGNEPDMANSTDADYKGLSEPWTSTVLILSQLAKLIKENNQTIQKSREQEAQNDIGPIEDASAQIQKLTWDMASLIDLYCKLGNEACQYHHGRESEEADALMTKSSEERADAGTLTTAYSRKRAEVLRWLSDTYEELMESTIKLAEKYSDMEALVDTTVIEARSVSQMTTESKNTKDEARAAKAKKRMIGRMRGYLDRYGDAFADVAFGRHLDEGRPNELLEQARLYPKDVTDYLRRHPRAKKVGWINEASFEHNHFLAGRDLMDVAVSQETDLWSKKVELSIAKLALESAGTRGDAQDNEELKATKESQRDALNLVKIQEYIYAHIRPKLYDAVDKEAEVQLAMEAFGKEAVAKSPRLQQLLERGMEKLVNHMAMDADQLIDVLTLMDQIPCEFRADDICGQESLLALVVLIHAGLANDRPRLELLLRIIWRRCFLKDDWEEINDTVRKSDLDAMEDLESTTLFKTVYEGFARGVWEEESSAGVRILAPKDVLGAGTTGPEHMPRFSSPDLSEPIAEEMAQEDVALQGLMDNYRLEHWVAATKEAAARRWAAEEETMQSLALKLGTATKAIYDEDADLRRGGKIPGTWRDAVRMGLGMFR